MFCLIVVCCRLRARVAGGLTSQPPAADMRELEWDEELARAAQAHAEQCKFRHDCPDCRRVKRFKAGCRAAHRSDATVPSCESFYQT